MNPEQLHEYWISVVRDALSDQLLNNQLSQIDRDEDWTGLCLGMPARALHFTDAGRRYRVLICDVTDVPTVVG